MALSGWSNSFKGLQTGAEAQRLSARIGPVQPCEAVALLTSTCHGLLDIVLDLAAWAGAQLKEALESDFTWSK